MAKNPDGAGQFRNYFQEVVISFGYKRRGSKQDQRRIGEYYLNQQEERSWVAGKNFLNHIKNSGTNSTLLL
jgi:hypothetical protein